MFCPFCGNNKPDGIEVCPYCGGYDQTPPPKDIKSVPVISPGMQGNGAGSWNQGFDQEDSEMMTKKLDESVVRVNMPNNPQPGFQRPAGGMNGMPGMQGGVPGQMGMPGMQSGVPGQIGMPGMQGGVPGQMGMPGMQGGVPGQMGMSGMQNMPGMQGGAPGMQNMGGMQADTVPEQPDIRNKKSAKKGRKSKKKAIIIISISAAVLIAAGLALFFILRSGSPKKATEEFMQAIVDGDSEKIVDSVSDGMYERGLSIIRENDPDILDELDIENASDAKEYLLDKLDDSDYERELEELQDAGIEVKVLSEEKVDKENAIQEWYEKNSQEMSVFGTFDAELSESDEDTLNQLFKGVDDFAIVKVKIKAGNESVDFYDLCYKEDGKWYSSLPATAIAPAAIRYIDKSKRSDDVAAAETINTACQAALANEDAYDEIADAMPYDSDEVVAIATAPADGSGKFKSLGASGVKNGASVFLDEVNTCVGDSVPKVKYDQEGASYWTIGISGAGKPVVWLGTSEGDTQWELQPTIDKKYK